MNWTGGSWKRVEKRSLHARQHKYFADTSPKRSEELPTEEHPSQSWDSLALMSSDQRKHTNLNDAIARFVTERKMGSKRFKRDAEKVVDKHRSPVTVLRPVLPNHIQLESNIGKTASSTTATPEIDNETKSESACSTYFSQPQTDISTACEPGIKANHLPNMQPQERAGGSNALPIMRKSLESCIDDDDNDDIILNPLAWIWPPTQVVPTTPASVQESPEGKSEINDK